MRQSDALFLKEVALMRAIRLWGSQRLMANALGVSRECVRNWVHRGSHIPYHVAILIEDKTQGQVRVETLCPEYDKTNAILRRWCGAAASVYDASEGTECV